MDRDANFSMDESKVVSVSATEARRRWKWLMAVVRGGQLVCITRYGRPVGVLWPIEDYPRQSRTVEAVLPKHLL